jgi:hypothetical protein
LEVKKRYLPSLLKAGEPEAYQPSVTVTVPLFSSPYR